MALSQSGVEMTQITGEDVFDVDTRLYKEREDDYCIIGNKM